MPFELILIQHGLTEWNVLRRSQGHTDVPLNETGLAQAAALAERLGGEAIEAVYSSDMTRTVQSVTPLAEALGLPVQVDWRLREGRWFRHVKDPDIPLLPFPVDKEEPADVLARLKWVLEEIEARHPSGRVLVMSHGAVLTRLVYHLDSLADWPFPPYEARGMAVNVLGRTARGRWEVRLLNDDGYLRERGLNKGRRHRRHRYRVIAWRGGELAGRYLPRVLHPVVQPLLHGITRRDRVLALEPTANLPSDWHVPLTELRDPAAT